MSAKQRAERTGHGPAQARRRSEGQAAAGRVRAHGARILRAAFCVRVWWVGLRAPFSSSLIARASATAYYVSQLPDLDELLDPRDGGSVTLARRRRARPSPGAGSSCGVTTRRGSLAAPGQRDRRHRGPALLLAFRDRPAGHGAGAAGQSAGRRDRAGRLVDHPAGREARLVRQQPDAGAQDQGDPGRAGAGVEVLQERDPVDLSQPRLSRRRRRPASRRPRSAISASPPPR